MARVGREPAERRCCTSLAGARGGDRRVALRRRRRRARRRPRRSPRRRRSRSRTQINFTRENEYEADRIGFQRLDAAGFDVNAMATFMDRLQKSSRFADGNAPSYLRTHPITYERIAEAQARALGQALPAGARLARLPSGARAAAQLPGHAAAKPSRTSTPRSPSASSTTRSRRATASSRRCCATRNSRGPRRSSRALEKIAPPHPMIEAMAGHVLMEVGRSSSSPSRASRRRSRAIRTRCSSIYDYPEALIKAGRPREAAAFLDAAARALPGQRPAAPDRRARLRRARPEAAAAPASGRVLRMAGRPPGRGAPVRAGVESGRRRLLPDVRRRGPAARAAQGAGGTAGRARQERLIRQRAGAAHRRTRSATASATRERRPCPHGHRRQASPSPATRSRPAAALAPRARSSPVRSRSARWRRSAWWLFGPRRRRAGVPAGQGRARRRSPRSSRPRARCRR